jgi:hypothetical protein
LRSRRAHDQPGLRHKLAILREIAAERKQRPPNEP